MSKIGQGTVSTTNIIQVVEQFGSPLYLYDESTVLKKCDDVLNMPHAFGLTVRYAQKANSNKDS